MEKRSTSPADEFPEGHSSGAGGASSPPMSPNTAKQIMALPAEHRAEILGGGDTELGMERAEEWEAKQLIAVARRTAVGATAFPPQDPTGSSSLF